MDWLLRMRKDETIFVAGGTGMVGRAIVRRLLAEAARISSATITTEDPPSLLRRRSPSFIWTSPAERRSNSSNRPILNRSISLRRRWGASLPTKHTRQSSSMTTSQSPANVIKAAHKYGVKKLLNLGSSCIYPKFAPQPMKEEHLLTGLLEPTNEAYAIAKIAAIKLCRYFNEQYGTDFLSVMPTNLFGPHDNYNLETAHVLPATGQEIPSGKTGASRRSPGAPVRHSTMPARVRAG